MDINRYSLKVIRELRGETVSALAIAAGIKQPHLSNIEKGVRRASDELIYSLARALGDIPPQAIVIGRIES